MKLTDFVITEYLENGSKYVYYSYNDNLSNLVNNIYFNLDKDVLNISIYDLRKRKIVKTIKIKESICKKNINISSLITKQFYLDNPLENKSYNEIIKEHFENKLTYNNSITR